MTVSFVPSRPHLAKFLRERARLTTPKQLTNRFVRQGIAQRYATDALEIGGLGLAHNRAETKQIIEAIAVFIEVDHLLWAEVKGVEQVQTEESEAPLVVKRNRLPDLWSPPEGVAPEERGEYQAPEVKHQGPPQSDSSTFWWTFGITIVIGGSLLVIALCLFVRIWR